MDMRLMKTAFVASLLVAGCSAPDSRPPGADRTEQRDEATKPPASFVNRVWAVAESEQVAVGELRVFLAEGTLVMASSHGTPAFGAWRYDNGQLTITEESIDYPVDILELDERTFKIRIRGPGEPIVIRFEPAEQPLPGAAGVNVQRRSP
jgi:hypothetical protein